MKYPPWRSVGEARQLADLPAHSRQLPLILFLRQLNDVGFIKAGKAINKKPG
jgi:hypothetical protein